ncbi:MAG TPA: DUF448 domain-containing protein [Candidatus Binataceae bacterium]|nr:DUF448 domain-containing protein [Candidatus Binataceae bacterium]
MPAKSDGPERTCLGCMKHGAKRAMVRIAVVDGVAVADVTARRPGRGGYLHRDERCLTRFADSKMKSFRSLGQGVDRAQRLAIAQAIRSAAANFLSRGASD